MNKILTIIIERWKAQVPVFFKWIMGIGAGVATIALAIQMALDSGGAKAPEWWETLYPYLIGVGAGLTACAKLTKKQ